MLQGRQLRGARETLHFLCNHGFRVGMLEVNNVNFQRHYTDDGILGAICGSIYGTAIFGADGIGFGCGV